MPSYYLLIYRLKSFDCFFVNFLLSWRFIWFCFKSLFILEAICWIKFFYRKSCISKLIYCNFHQMFLIKLSKGFVDNLIEWINSFYWSLVSILKRRSFVTISIAFTLNSLSYSWEKNGFCFAWNKRSKNHTFLHNSNVKNKNIWSSQHLAVINDTCWF